MVIVKESIDRQSLLQEAQSDDIAGAYSFEETVCPSAEEMIETVNTLCSGVRPVGSSEERNACKFLAVLLEIAKLIRNLPCNKEIRFILFGGEENMLCGSRYYVGSLTENELRRIKANTNLDTLAGKGLADPHLFTIDGKKNSSTNIITGIEENENLRIEEAPISDHFTFAQAGIASLTIGQIDTNSKIHTPEDSIENIDEDG